MFLQGTEHASLDPKNVLALRTLFAVAHRLALLLGESWLLVLGTVNCLDCILNTPRQSFQVWFVGKPFRRCACFDSCMVIGLLLSVMQAVLCPRRGMQADVKQSVPGSAWYRAMLLLIAAANTCSKLGGAFPI